MELEMEVERKVTTKGILLVCGRTGSGKTTKIPPIFMKMSNQGSKLPVAITVPTRLAACDLTHSLRRIYGNESVGYQIRGDSETNDSNRMIFMTTGLLLRIVIPDPCNIFNYSAIIVDEVHENSLHTTTLLGILRLFYLNPPNVIQRRLEKGDKFPKLVLMSATMDQVKYLKYFQVFDVQHCPTSQEIDQFVVQMGGINAINRKMTLEKKYLDDMEGGDTFEFDIGKPKFEKTIISIVLQEIRRLRNHKKWSKGHILVFLPGVGEIHAFMDMYDSLEEEKKNLHLVPVYSRLSDEEQQMIHEEPPQYHRKVILATNVAESSVTIKSVSIVFNFCLTKQSQVDLETGYEELKLEWSSTDQNIQREGRTARTCDGMCYNLVTKEFDAIHKELIPEIQRMSLEDVYLILKHAEKALVPSIPSVSQFLNEGLLDAPFQNQITQTVNNLLTKGALVFNPVTEKLKITWAGECFTKFPLSHRFCKLLILSESVGLMKDGIYLTSCCNTSNKSLFKNVTQSLTSWFTKLEFANKSGSDEIAELNCYKCWEKVTQGNHVEVPHNMKQEFDQVHMSLLRRIDLMNKDVKKRASRIFSDTSSGQSMHGLTKEQVECTKMKDMLMLKLCIAGSVQQNNLFLTKPVILDRKVDLPALNCDERRTVYFLDADGDTNNKTFRDLYNERYNLSRNQSFKLDMNRATGLLLVKYDDMEPTPVCDMGVLTALQKGKIKKSTLIVPKIPNSTVYHLTNFVSPSFFHVIPSSKLSQYKKISAEFDRKFEKDEFMGFKHEELIPGATCVIYDEEAKEDWGMKLPRGVVKNYPTSVTPERENDMVNVYCIDTGITKTINWCKVWKLKSQDHMKIMMETPPLCIPCWLPTVRPTPAYGPVWNRFSILKASKILKTTYMFDNTLKLRNSFVNEDGLLVCEDIYAAKGQNRSLVQQLMEKGLAEMDKRYACYFPATGITEMRRETELKGPYSPLVLDFSPLTTSSNSKKVRVRLASVNSITIRCNQDECAKLLVAASVQQNDDVLHLENTTLLPAVPGLCEIVLLLHSPVIQVVQRDDIPVLINCFRKTQENVALAICSHTTMVKLSNKDLCAIKECRHLLNSIFMDGSEKKDRHRLRLELTSLVSKVRPCLDAEWLESVTNDWTWNEKSEVKCANTLFLEDIIFVNI